MKLSDLQDKDVVNINDGKKIGNIIDVNIDLTGNAKEIVVERYHFFFSLFSTKVTEIKWDKIRKIGKDVILVNID